MADTEAAAASEAQAVYTGERKNGRMEGYGTCARNPIEYLRARFTLYPHTHAHTHRILSRK